MVALFPEGFEEREDALALELAGFGDSVAAERLARRLGPVKVEPLEPGWEERWKTFHRPVRIGRLWVGPPWERPEEDAAPVVIDPGRAFGTGAHPTTRLCLELLLGLAPTSVVDLGSGSGVLAVAAARLSFSPVFALDLDPAAVEATRANAAANEVVIDVATADVLADPLPDALVAVANIALPVVEALAARLPAGRLIASGYLENETLDVPGWRRLQRRECEGWAADLLERFYH